MASRSLRSPDAGSLGRQLVTVACDRPGNHLERVACASAGEATLDSDVIPSGGSPGESSGKARSIALKAWATGDRTPAVVLQKVVEGDRDRLALVKNHECRHMWILPDGLSAMALSPSDEWPHELRCSRKNRGAVRLSGAGMPVVSAVASAITVHREKVASIL